MGARRSSPVLEPKGTLLANGRALSLTVSGSSGGSSALLSTKLLSCVSVASVPAGLQSRAERQALHGRDELLLADA